MTDSNKIIGVVPAGGPATRISSFFKEILPVTIDEDHPSKFIITSERIIASMLFAGADKIHLILQKRKSFIEDYYRDQNLFPEGKVLYSYLPKELEPLGMPYTIHLEFESFKKYDYVLLGLPDTVIEPQSSFQAILALHKNCGADLALGLFITTPSNFGGLVEFNEETKVVKKHIDHTSPQFPEAPKNAWVIACWNNKFSNFIHEALIEQRKIRFLASRRGWTEIVFGDVIDLALSTSELRIVADYIDKENGYFWDITNPKKYFDLLNSYNLGEKRFVHQSQSALSNSPISLSAKKRVFIGHGRSSTWKYLRDFLEKKLNVDSEEFNRIPSAGYTTVQHISEMADRVSMAFLVLTGEDEHKDGTLHARENVIHELGIFQALFGNNKAIILLEDGCQEFSNISGLNQIRFPKGNILAKADEIIDVLKREDVISISVANTGKSN